MSLQSITICVLITFLKLNLTTQISTPADPTYYAAVVEFAPEQGSTAKSNTKQNMLRMKSIIESDETRDLDIIVFPEFVLNTHEFPTYVPNPEERIAPCEIPNYDNFLTELSCSVRSRKLYAVFNLMEKVDCRVGTRLCNSDGLTFFNTNVVLDREGRVISRYRKTHLYRYEWYKTNTQSTPDVSIFTTDFGVSFGHFICFDMLFYEPAMSLLRKHNITDIVYPTYWFSELPFLTAVQLQEGWAFANDVNLLAADGSNPAGQNTGSGIYAGRLGRLVAAIYQEPTTTILKARVPKHGRRLPDELPPIFVPQFIPSLETPRFTKMDLLRDYNVDIFSTKLLAEDFVSINERVCHNDFCCEFNVSRTLISASSSHSAYRYRLSAYEGSNVTFQRIDRSDLSVCALMACTNAELYSCGHIFPEGNTLVGNKYYFKSIEVRGEFRRGRRSIQPSTVDGNMMPLPISMYKWSESEGANKTAVSIKMTSPKSDLLTFGIWANYYTDAVTTHNVYLPSRVTNSASDQLKGGFPVMFTVGILVKMLWSRVKLF